MATRGTIAVQHADGTVSQVYAHWDNYLEGTGQTLLHCYNSLELAEQLVAGGDISSVDNTVDSTVYYKRDRGEANTDARVFANINSYYSTCEGEEYNYLFQRGQWFVEHYDTGGEYLPLIKELADD
jgi:hypothetical protein